MMFEMRSPTNGIPDRRANCPAIVSPTSFESAYEDSGRTADSSTGAKAGGVSGANGSPSTVSLEAQTTRPTPRSTAAAKTL